MRGEKKKEEISRWNVDHNENCNLIARLWNVNSEKIEKLFARKWHSIFCHLNCSCSCVRYFACIVLNLLTKYRSLNMSGTRTHTDSKGIDYRCIWMMNSMAVGESKVKSLCQSLHKRKKKKKVRGLKILTIINIICISKYTTPYISMNFVHRI